MECTNNEPFNREEAPLRNFVWKIKGEKQPPLASGYFGASLYVDKGAGSSVFDKENISFTLTPLGRLVDGSNGAVITEKLIRDTRRLLDIAIGKYKITARHQDGRLIKLRIAAGGSGAYVNELEVEILPRIEGTANLFCDNCAAIEYHE